MKKATLILSAFITLLMISCEVNGVDGRDGLPGNDGRDGVDGIQGKVLEIDGVNFDYNNNTNLYSTLLTYSDFTDFVVSEPYSVLIYRFDAQVDLTDGPANNWSLIPQNFFIPEGTIQYSYAHNFVDTELFIDGNFDLANLNPDFTENQFFRIVFVPGDFLTSKTSKSDINAVMSSLGIEEKNVQKVKL